MKKAQYEASCDIMLLIRWLLRSQVHHPRFSTNRKLLRSL